MAVAFRRHGTRPVVRVRTRTISSRWIVVVNGLPSITSGAVILAVSTLHGSYRGRVVEVPWIRCTSLRHASVILRYLAWVRNQPAGGLHGVHRWLHRAIGHGSTSTRNGVCRCCDRGAIRHGTAPAGYGVGDMQSIELVQHRSRIIRRWRWNGIDLEIWGRRTLLRKVWHGAILLCVEGT